jgi:hypothetical protein
MATQDVNHTFATVNECNGDFSTRTFFENRELHGFH